MVSRHGATVHRPTSIIYVFCTSALRLIYFSKPRDHAIPFLLNQTAFLCSLCSFNSLAI